MEDDNCVIIYMSCSTFRVRMRGNRSKGMAANTYAIRKLDLGRNVLRTLQNVANPGAIIFTPLYVH